jgi:hypothetical protein
MGPRTETPAWLSRRPHRVADRHNAYLAAIGAAVSLGGIWCVAYRAGENGAAVFIVVLLPAGLLSAPRCHWPVLWFNPNGTVFPSPAIARCRAAFLAYRLTVSMSRFEEKEVKSRSFIEPAPLRIVRSAALSKRHLLPIGVA